MKNKKIIKLVISIMLGLSVMSTGVSATNEISGNQEANGAIPLTITTTGLTIKATLPISVNFTINSNSVSPNQVFESQLLEIKNDTITGTGVKIPINISYGALEGIPTDVTVFNDKSQVTYNLNSLDKNIAVILDNGTEQYLTPLNTVDTFKKLVTDSEKYKIKLFCSPAIKYGTSVNMHLSMPVKISLY